MKTHYTYMIEVLEPTDQRRYYVGVRSCDGSIIDDKYYLGSSKYLKQWIKENGKDKIKKTILAIWPTRELAMEHEIRIHDHFEVHLNEEFFNKSKQSVSGFTTYGMESPWKGKTFSKESLEKLSESCMGRPSPWKGKTCSEEMKQKIRESKAKNPYRHTEEHKQKMRERFKQKTECPHCGKIGSGPVMYKYHFTNCKVKNDGK